MYQHRRNRVSFKLSPFPLLISFHLKDFSLSAQSISISNQGHIEIVKELLKNGADPSIKNNAGNTAFEESLESNNSDELLNILDEAQPHGNSEFLAKFLFIHLDRLI